jgi:hypothetical protein
MEGSRSVYRILVGKFEEGRQLGLPSKDNIKMDLQEVG